MSVVVQLHAAITESEREKLDLEQRHSRQLQRVLEESQAQVDKMEAEYNTQIRANVSTVCVCVCVCVCVSWAHSQISSQVLCTGNEAGKELVSESVSVYFPLSYAYAPPHIPHTPTNPHTHTHTHTPTHTCTHTHTHSQK